MTTVEKHTDDDEVGLEHAEEFARTHPGLVKFGRIGWVAKGVVYALTGFLALLIAFDSTPGRGGDAVTRPGGEPERCDRPDRRAHGRGTAAARDRGRPGDLFVLAHRQRPAPRGQ